MVSRPFIGIVAHVSDLGRSEGAASVLRSLGARIRTLPLWDDPHALFQDDDAEPRALILEVLDRPDLAPSALRTLRDDPRLEHVGVLLAVSASQVARIEPSSGIDDIVIVPYVPDELYARICQIEWRRRKKTTGARISVGKLVIDADAHEVLLEGTRMHLSALAFDVLTYLARHRGRLVSRDELLQHVWGTDYVGGVRAVDICVCHLRAKLGDALPLATLRGHGYRLDAMGTMDPTSAPVHASKGSRTGTYDRRSGGPMDFDWRGAHAANEGARRPSAYDRLGGFDRYGPYEGSQVRAFIKVTEVWVPTKDHVHLERSQGLYGSHDDLDRVRAPMRFAYGEGLPGKAWAARHPIVFRQLEGPAFERTEAAGLTCGIALPIFAGDVLVAVLVFFCGDEEQHVGAIELWGNRRAGDRDLALVHGYYGTADVFEEESRRVRFRSGSGLPGLVWKTGMPVVMDDLGQSPLFVRSKSARKVGIHRGLGLPCSVANGPMYVMTFLSSIGTPIARRFEIWAPSPDGNTLVFLSGECDKVPDLAAAYRSVGVRRGDGMLGRVWLSGVPTIAEDLASSRSIESVCSEGLESAVVVPVMEDGRIKCVVAVYF